MSIALLDVNVLVALFDPKHLNHEDAQRWFGLNKRLGWSSCPLTIKGCIRVLSNPAYPTVSTTPAAVAERLRDFCASPRWPIIHGHQKLTDIYLLKLAVHNHRRLATFDRSIPLTAVHGAAPTHVVVPAT